MHYWILVLGILYSISAATAADRHAAMFADGSRVDDAEIRDWNQPDSPATIDGRLLFPPQNPVRWIVNRSLPLERVRGAYVEFAGGDRICGEVVSYATGQDDPYDIRPPHFIVKPASELQPPEAVNAAEVRVAIEWVQRIVWESAGRTEYLPGTVWLRTGSSLTFRSLRWNSTGVVLLTSEGVKQFPIADLGELHLPKLDPWSSYFDQVATLSPDGQSRLIQIDCQDGSRWTTSFQRFQPRSLVDRNRAENQFQWIQPAWCLDSIWLRFRTIRSWRFFQPNEVPLSIIPPSKTTHDPVFGRGLVWQTNLNVQHGALRSLHHDFGWGFGVHGTTKLEFELPESAFAVRTKFGLDRVAGSGGCVTTEVVANEDQVLSRHANLVGSEFVGEMQWTELPATPQRRITLRSEMAHQGRPNDADPFDIRDLLNWYEPEVRLEPTALLTELISRGRGRMASLQGWTLSERDSPSMRVANIVDGTDPADPQVRAVFRSTERFYTLSKKFKIAAGDRWLSLAVARFPQHSRTTLQVRIDGRVHGDFEIPVRQSLADPEPLRLFVEPFQGRTVAVECVLYPQDNESWIDWRGQKLNPERPGILTLFEDDQTLIDRLTSGQGAISVDGDQPFSGQRSLKIGPGIRGSPRIPGLDALIGEHPRLSQFRYLVFAWKKPSGSRIQIQLADRGRFAGETSLPDGVPINPVRLEGLRRMHPMDDRGMRFRYRYEEGIATVLPPIPLWMHGELPRKWQLIQRDLFQDFGTLNLTGFSLNAEDGEVAWFDHLYLARTLQDVEFLKQFLVNPPLAAPVPGDDGLLEVSAKEDFASTFSQVAPLFSSPHTDFRMKQAKSVGDHQPGQVCVLSTDHELRWRAGIELPSERDMKLEMEAAHPLGFNWQLVVSANGDTLFDQEVNDKSASNQQHVSKFQIDLAKFQGQKVLIEVIARPQGPMEFNLVWKRIALRE